MFWNTMPMRSARRARSSSGDSARLLHTIAIRVARALEKQGLLLRDDDTPSLDLEPADGFEQLLGAAVHYRIAVGPHTGRRALTLRTVASNPLPDNPSIAQLSGFSLHAGTRCQAHERDSLERLCRYIARPAVSNERLSVNDRGQVVYRLKHPFHDGTTHVARPDGLRQDAFQVALRAVPGQRHQTRIPGTSHPGRHTRFDRRIRYLLRREKSAAEEKDRGVAGMISSPTPRIGTARVPGSPRSCASAPDFRVRSLSLPDSRTSIVGRVEARCRVGRVSCRSETPSSGVASCRMWR